MIDYKSHTYVQPILHFLDKINIPYQLTAIETESSLPGIFTKNGSLLIDTNLLKYPGDILHEAGHIALAPWEVRANLTTPIDAQLDFDAATHELMTLAWSYAAAVESGTPVEVLFHPEGYKGQNESLSFAFQSGQYIGLPMLQWLGMAYDANNAMVNNAMPFPHMMQWLRPMQTAKTT